MKDKQKRSAMWGRNFLVMCALIAFASLAFASPHSHKISRKLWGKTSGRINVIVRFNQSVTTGMDQKVFNRGGQRSGVFRGNRRRGVLHLIRSGVYSMPVSQLESLASDPSVAYIAPDLPVHNLGNTSGGTPARLRDLRARRRPKPWHEAGCA